LSGTTQGTSTTARLRTTTGFCFAIMRIAESDIREPPRTTPSTTGSTRSSADRSSRSDSWASASRIVQPACAAVACAPRMISE
jgi:hypothetical protein